MRYADVAMNNEFAFRGPDMAGFLMIHNKPYDTEEYLERAQKAAGCFDGSGEVEKAVYLLRSTCEEKLAALRDDRTLSERVAGEKVRNWLRENAHGKPTAPAVVLEGKIYGDLPEVYHFKTALRLLRGTHPFTRELSSMCGRWFCINCLDFRQDFLKLVETIDFRVRSVANLLRAMGHAYVDQAMYRNEFLLGRHAVSNDVFVWLNGDMGQYIQLTCPVLKEILEDGNLGVLDRVMAAEYGCRAFTFKKS